VNPSRVRQGFLDESGGTGSAAEGDHFLVVAVLLTFDPRPIELHIKRARKRLRRKPDSGEMKATHSATRTISRLLQAIVETDLASREVRIEHGDSQRSKGLQAVDYVVWAVRQKYEWEDEQFYRIIESRIVIEEVRKMK